MTKYLWEDYETDNVPAISEDDLNSIRYFHEDKSDVTRWCGWDDFKTRHPEVAQVYDDYRGRIERAERIFNLYLDKLENKAIEE